MTRFLGIILLIVATMVLSGCTTYYRVEDPRSGSVYYTTNYQEKTGGSIAFQDEKTGKKITIQNSTVEKISMESFKTAVEQPTG